MVPVCSIFLFFCDQDLGRGGGRRGGGRRGGGRRVKIGKDTFFFFLVFQIPRMELGRHTA